MCMYMYMYMYICICICICGAKYNLPPWVLAQIITDSATSGAVARSFGSNQEMLAMYP